MSESHHKNRLDREVSPYLLSHAENPIDWYPWSEEAFQAAKSQDKPIFLSIGYSSCHWCHRMEQESFEDESLASVMNETFINIKVDREELPEVDSLYMEFAQSMLEGNGGWPLNVILTPDLKPVFAATYLPKDGKVGQLGLRQLAQRINQIWHHEERELVLEQAERLVEGLRARSLPKKGELLEEDLLDMVLEIYYRLADPIHGGMEGAPKFPMAHWVNFLLRHAHFHSESRALFCAQMTLDMMARGGLYDQLGGGFSRYTVDSAWQIPHFEKMLYDNALLVVAYTESAQMTGSESYRTVAKETMAYLLSEMRDPGGGFYSSQDADSEGHEGLYYTWRFEDLFEILGGEEGRLFADYYGVTPAGNFEGRNILHIPHPMEEFAALRHIDPKVLNKQLGAARDKLRAAREKRVRPKCDDKSIAAWNGLAIRACAEAAALFLDKNYLEAATNAALFVRKEMWNGGRLLRRYRAGRAGVNGSLEDYAYLISGCLSLYRSGGMTEWLLFAIELTSLVSSLFRAPEGGYYRTDGSDPNLLVRQIEFYDGAEPSGNAVQCENLLRLYQITGFDRYRSEAEDLMGVAKGFLEFHPVGGAYHCLALQRYLNTKAPTLVVAWNEERQFEEEIRALLARRYSPHLEIIWRKKEDKPLFELLPTVRSQESVAGQTTLYLCREGVCEPPVTGIEKIEELIRAL